MHPLVPPFFNGVVYTQLAIYLLAAMVWRRDFGSSRTRLRLLRITRRVAIVAATVPASTFLANLLPWWRFPVPLLGDRRVGRAVRRDHLRGRAARAVGAAPDRPAGRRLAWRPCSSSAATS